MSNVVRCRRRQLSREWVFRRLIRFMRVLAIGMLMACTAAGQTSAPAEWRTLPLVVKGTLDSGWKHVGWGGFVVDQGVACTQVDARGMGLLVYTREKFG